MTSYQIGQPYLTRGWRGLSAHLDFPTFSNVCAFVQPSWGSRGSLLARSDRRQIAVKYHVRNGQKAAASEQSEGVACGLSPDRTKPGPRHPRHFRADQSDAIPASLTISPRLAVRRPR
jgi:hypothetical protein